MSEADKKLITFIAEVWIVNGGDAEGFNYSMLKILETIRERERQISEEPKEPSK